jgi:hypothetical protein
VRGDDNEPQALRDPRARPGAEGQADTEEHARLEEPPPPRRARRHREEILKRLGMERVLDTIRRGDRGEKEALELLTRESGGVILNPKEER